MIYATSKICTGVVNTSNMRSIADAPLLEVELNGVKYESTPKTSHTARVYVCFNFSYRSNGVGTLSNLYSTSVGELQSAITQLALGLKPVITFKKEA